MISKDFYREVVNSLKKSDIKFRINNLSPTFISDLSEVEKKNYAERFCVPIMDIPEGKILPQVASLLMFLLFDTFLEDKYSLNSGQSYNERYGCLTENNDIEIIEKECYRLLKLIRNACVHNNASILNNDPIAFGYDFRRTKFNLDISKEMLNLLFSIMVFIVMDNYKLKTVGHFNGIIRSYYDELKGYIDKSGNLQDEHKALMKSISNRIRIKPQKRNIIVHPKYETSHDALIIINYMAEDYPWYGIDYLVDFNAAEYIIPNECLSKDKTIQINSLDEWKVIK